MAGDAAELAVLVEDAWRRHASFAAQEMMTLLGAQLIEMDAGRCVLGLAYRPKLSQQHGYFHGGAAPTVADDCATALQTVTRIARPQPPPGRDRL